MHVHASDISFSYSRSSVLKDVTFEVLPGEFLSILGPNGSGKSTLLRLLARILLPGKGTITLDRKPLSSYSRISLAKAIGYVPQEVQWFLPFTVMEVVLMGRTPYGGRFGFENPEDVRQAQKAMEQTDIAHLAGEPITGISGGERQRVLIARALAQNPSILLLDEPNAHLDLSHQVDIFRILRQQHRDQGLTIISVSHDLNLAAAYSTSILMLAGETPGRNNTVVAHGPPELILTPESIKRVFQTSVIVDRIPSSNEMRISIDRASVS